MKGVLHMQQQSNSNLILGSASGIGEAQVFLLYMVTTPTAECPLRTMVYLQGPSLSGNMFCFICYVAKILIRVLFEIPTYNLVFISSLRSRSIDLIRMDPPHTEWWFFKNFFMRCPPLQLFFPLSTGQHLQDPTFCICKWVCRWLNHSERKRAKSSFKRCHSEERIYMYIWLWQGESRIFDIWSHSLSTACYWGTDSLYRWSSVFGKDFTVQNHK